MEETTRAARPTPGRPLPPPHGQNCLSPSQVAELTDAREACAATIREIQALPAE